MRLDCSDRRARSGRCSAAGRAAWCSYEIRDEIRDRPGTQGFRSSRCPFGAYPGHTPRRPDGARDSGRRLLADHSHLRQESCPSARRPPNGPLPGPSPGRPRPLDSDQSGNRVARSLLALPPSPLAGAAVHPQRLPAGWEDQPARGRGEGERLERAGSRRPCPGCEAVWAMGASSHGRLVSCGNTVGHMITGSVPVLLRCQLPHTATMDRAS
jgi:hypothetical protein